MLYPKGRGVSGGIKQGKGHIATHAAGEDGNLMLALGHKRSNDLLSDICEYKLAVGEACSAGDLLPLPPTITTWTMMQRYRRAISVDRSKQ